MKKHGIQIVSIALSVMLISTFSGITYASPHRGIISAREMFADQNGKYVPATDYIQDGLIAMWDARENAGWGLYDQNATTWKDLIGNRDLVLSSHAQFWNGCITRKIGTRSFFYLAKLETSIPEARTMEACYASSQVNDGGIVFSIGLSQRGLGQYTYSNSKTTVVCRNKYEAEIPLNIFQCLIPIVTACRWEDGDSTAKDLFLNGTLLQQTSSSAINWGTSAWQYIKILGRGEYDGTNYKSGYCFRVYNRTLTDEEIAHNYAVDKERFNLP